MKKHVALLALGIFCLSTHLGCAQENKEKKTDKPADKPAASASAGLTTDAQRIGYSIGVDISENVKRQFEGMEVDLDAMVKGFQDGLKGASKMTEEEMRKVAEEFRQKMSQARNAQGAKNTEAGKKFLEENAKKEGVKTTASGLQYQVLKEGKGDKPKATDSVTVHYKGTLTNGKEFDSSYGRGEPATFPLNRVIPGWTEGLQLMTVGSKYKFFIPSELAYGESGAGADIPPNSVLVFEVELLKINK